MIYSPLPELGAAMLYVAMLGAKAIVLLWGLSIASGLLSQFNEWRSSN